ncbi:MAG: hypothetical protein WCG87_12505 [Bacteroidota bacterium]
MNDRLKHIFDNSSCLTRRQMRQYVSGAMSAEERHASEVHMNSCAFCSEALDGMLAHRKEAVGLMVDMSPAFIKEHFELTKPQVHVNSLAVSANMSAAQAKKHARRVQFNWRMVFLIGGVLSAFAVMWYVEFIKDIARKKHLPEPSVASTPIVEPANAKPSNKVHHIVTAPSSTTTHTSVNDKAQLHSSLAVIKPDVEHKGVAKTINPSIAAPMHKAVVSAKKVPAVEHQSTVAKPIVKTVSPVQKPDNTPANTISSAPTPASSATPPVNKENVPAAIIGPPVDPAYKAK